MNPIQKVVAHLREVKFHELTTAQEGVDLLDSIFTEEDWSDPGMRRWCLGEIWRCSQRARNRSGRGKPSLNTHRVDGEEIVQGYLDLDRATEAEFQSALDDRAANITANRAAVLRLYKYGTEVRGFQLTLPLGIEP
jgi:hypothetical protein